MNMITDKEAREAIIDSLSTGAHIIAPEHIAFCSYPPEDVILGKITIETASPAVSPSGKSSDVPESDRDSHSAHKKVNPIAIAASVFLFLAIAVSLFFLLSVKPLSDHFDLELGETVSDDPRDYLSGSPLAMFVSRIDLTDVNASEKGEYPVTLKCLWQKFDACLIIADTKAPVIVKSSGPHYFAPDTALSPSAFVDSIEDADSNVSLYFSTGSPANPDIFCDRVGDYLLTICASDSSGNISSESVSFTVDLPPEITGAGDIYVATGNDLDLLYGIKAIDETSGDVTKSIEVILPDDFPEANSDGTYSFDEDYSYVITYRATDEYGISSEKGCVLTSASAGTIQSLIGTRAINRHDSRIIGAYNPYDNGESLSGNIDSALNESITYVVSLYHRTDFRHYVTGSGFITEITDDGIYICTNAHVAEEADTFAATFYDGSHIIADRIGYSESYDIGVLFIPLERMPDSLMDTVSTVHINKTGWNALSSSSTPVGIIRLNNDTGAVDRLSTGELAGVHKAFDFLTHKPQTEVTARLIEGDSGSAIIDDKGNLIAVAFCYTTGAQTRYWGVPLDGTLECYKEITGRELFTY